AQPVLTVGLKGLRGSHRDALEISAEGDEERPRRLLHTNAQRIFVHDLDLLNLLVVRSHPRFDLRIADTVNIPLGCFSIEVRTIVEFYPLLQVKNVRSAFVQYLP